ncbi:MAG: DeoR/GlpR family DNA-binding transcription regulator [Planctomycetota bacterium]|jgi:DeoR/GlpR family transcriptional regulator of sugar metabolism|nr:DeoR/GlpR family DNA-binding transcription regulator [Planctomycetota bacterium]
MYRADRLNAILSYLNDHQSMSVDQAMREFSASSATIRRDFSHLIASGMAARGPNEVRKPSAPALGIDPPFSVRKMTMRAEKRAIARRAAGYLKNGDVVFIDGGTTTHCMVEFLGALELRVVTTCIHVANSLNELRQDNGNLEIVMPGGVLMPRSNVLYGAHTSDQLQTYFARWAFIGVDGTDGTSLFSVNEFISSSQKTMIANSDRTVLLMDHAKYRRPSMVRTIDLDERFVIVTDKHESLAEMADKVRKSGAELTFVEP